MGLGLAIILALLLIFAIRWYVQHRRYKKLLKKFPGPPPLPLVGNALDLTTTTAVLSNLLEYSQTYGGIVKLHIGPTPSVLLVTDYDLVEFVLSSTKLIQKGSEYRFIASWLGEGLILSGGDKWRTHRKIITPTFHFKILEQFIEVFESNAKTLVEKLKQEVHNPSVDVHPYLGRCTLDTICETAMGTTVDAQNDTESEYVRSVQMMCQILVLRAFTPLRQVDLFYKFSKLYQKEKKAVKVLHDYANFVIRKRKSESSNNHGKVTQSTTKLKLAFLDLLLQENELNQNLTEQEIREEVDNFIFAGHDTISSTMGFALYCLAENQDAQEKAIEELERIFADDKFRPSTLKDLQDMKYVECVIKETLRVYPAVPFFARNIFEDIDYGGTVIPKGTSIFINVFGIHRNSKVYPEPEEFIPERFSPENCAQRRPFDFIPFSAGPRNCVGQRFAMLEMKTLLCTILKHYRILPANPKHKLVLADEGVLASTSGICVCLEERNF